MADLQPSFSVTREYAVVDSHQIARLSVVIPMPLPDTKAVMTAEERAKAFLDRYGLRFKGGDQFRVHYGSGLLETMLTEEFREAVEEERDRWMRATEHEHTCEYVQSPQTLCTCGAHVRLALLHGEAAYAIRARKANHDS